MKALRRRNIIAAALVGALAFTTAHAQAAAQKKAAPAAVEQSAYATAVEAYIRFLPRFYTFGF